MSEEPKNNEDAENADDALAEADVKGHGMDDDDDQDLSVTATGGVCM